MRFLILICLTILAAGASASKPDIGGQKVALLSQSSVSFDGSFDIIKFIQSLKNILIRIKNEGVMAVKDQIEAMQKILDSQQLKDFIKTLPESWQTAVQSVIDKIKAIIEIDIEKIAKELEDKVKALIKGIKDKVNAKIDANPVLKTLKMILGLLNLGTIKSIEEARNRLINLLNSPLFKFLENAFPENVKTIVNLLRKILGKPTFKLDSFANDSIDGVISELNALEIVSKIMNFPKKIIAKVGAAKDFAIAKIMAFIKSQAVQDALKKIPQALRYFADKVIAYFKALSKTASERLRALLVRARATTTQIIKLLKEKADVASVKIQQKLQDALKMIKQTSIKVQEIGAKKLLEIIDSASFQKVLSKLPQSIQKQVEQLRLRLVGNKEF